MRACEHVDSSPSLFAAPQCLGYSSPHKATKEMCLPKEESVIKQVKRLVRSIGNIKSVVVASDSNHMITPLSKALSRMEVFILV